MPTIKIELAKFKTDKQKELLKMLNDKRVLKQANTILKNYINKFVPKESGRLRRSAIVTYESISWGRRLGYARYQYEGEIYGPNYPIIQGGRVVGWYSKPGVPKHPTGRKIASYTIGNDLLNYHFGYSDPITRHHWDEKFNNDRRWKATANNEVTRYLKKECKKRGLSK